MNLPVHNQELLEKATSLFNKPVLDCFNVVRLIGYAETSIDSYWIFKSPVKSKIYWSSCVGSPIQLELLKTQGNDYEMLDLWLKYNGCPKEKTFRLIIHHNDQENDVFGNELIGAENYE